MAHRDDDDLEMTLEEKASLDASRAAIDDLAASIAEGADMESAEAALAAAKQASTQLDLDSLRDKLHVPDDAGEHEDGLRAIMMRIPSNWGRWISCSRGWYPIIIQLDRELAAIDPGYEVHQCKEKFGGLRFYFGASESISEADHGRMRALVREAEDRCEATCELCGGPGSRHVTPHGWYRTLCSTCATAEGRGYEPVGELVNDLTADMDGVWRVGCYADAPESIWDLDRDEVTVDDVRYSDFEVLLWPGVLRTWKLRLADGTEVDSGLIAAIERVR
ncbi:hypothetical protein BKG58_19705 [Mycobacteroides abscessus subsp. abscessus]|uniref:hypothetical protein n=1 Tax=Mycobacteroides abscessus TaxID=36809 RepID=UPI00037514B0|nr:hypothetical protein [Mycobacteroides abscessus]OLT79657.1 hypothetical protein BKG58_19705 [Mycobacteroides abscessus subsp. abscessus]